MGIQIELSEREKTILHYAIEELTERSCNHKESVCLSGVLDPEPGVTTDELNRLADKLGVKGNGWAGYEGEDCEHGEYEP